MNDERLKIAIKALEDVSGWDFGWDGDCGVTRCADEALSAIEAIVPPVAAGSVDTGNLTMWLKALYHAADGHQLNERLETTLYHINLYAEQAKEAGKQEALDLTISVGQLRQRAEKAEADVAYLKKTYAGLFDEIAALKQRAEKAEAELKQVNEWRAAALTESQTLGELWASKVEQAEARVKELEAGRQALQAEGTHPAPCARDCEANAFQIEVRRLELDLECVKRERWEQAYEIQALKARIESTPPFVPMGGKYAIKA